MVVLADTTMLLSTTVRVACSINGTCVNTLSGGGGVRLVDLFPTTADAAAAADATTAAATPLATLVRLTYPNWEHAATAVLSLGHPTVLRVDADGTETPVSVAFFAPAKQAARLARVEPVLQSAYDAAWARVEQVPFAACPMLTKTVTRVPAGLGLNGTGFSLAAAVNDTPPSMRDDTREALLARALRTEAGSDAAFAQLLADLRAPSPAAAATHAHTVAAALSLVAAYALPYRVDGVTTIVPAGLEMHETERWPTEPTRAFGVDADDCDGSAQLIVSIIRACADERATNARPCSRAVAHSLGAFYVYGVSVLGANAGHADAADEKATGVAGHAVAIALPKGHVLMAMAVGARARVRDAETGDETTVVDAADVEAVDAARFAALFPPELVARIPAEERTAYASSDALRRAAEAEGLVNGPQPVAMEGTTWACGRLYTHASPERKTRQAAFKRDAAALEAFGPSIARPRKTLDVGATDRDAHAFYSNFVELSLSTRSPLFTNPTLRRLGVATCHLRLCQTPQRGVIRKAGASPRELALARYTILPLWATNTEDGATLDEALAEALAHTIPARKRPVPLAEAATTDLGASLEALRGLQAHLDGLGGGGAGGKELKSSDKTVTIRTTIAFSALVHNPLCVAHACDVLRESPDVRSGTVEGLDTPVQGMAEAEAAPGIDLARLVVVSLVVKA